MASTNGVIMQLLTSCWMACGPIHVAAGWRQPLAAVNGTKIAARPAQKLGSFEPVLRTQGELMAVLVISEVT